MILNSDEVLKMVEQVLLSRQLNPIEKFVLHESCLGKTYSEMAQDSAYGIPHVKEIGSQLWQDLSDAVGERVTKKNLLLVLSHYYSRYAKTLRIRTSPELPTYAIANDNVPDLVTEREIEFPSRPVPLNSPLYLNRPPIEQLTCAEISQPGCVIRINAPRKMGKSSLLTRILAHAKTQGYKIVCIDFLDAEDAVFACLDKFLRWFCANISRQLHLNPMLDEYWDEDMGSKVSCKIYFEGYLLEEINCPLVLALNEVNRVFEYPSIAQDFLPMLRSWHEQARSVDAWQKLRLIVVHSTEVYIPLKINQSPFNVGLSVKLPCFNLEQVQELAQRYGLAWDSGNETQQLMAMVGGHPYLVNLALYHLRRENMTLEELLRTAPTQSGIYNTHLRDLLVVLRNEPRLTSALEQVVRANESVQLDAIAAYKLESMGLVQLEGNQAQLSCQLYRLYFGEQLRGENLNPKNKGAIASPSIQC